MSLCVIISNFEYYTYSDAVSVRATICGDLRCSPFPHVLSVLNWRTIGVTAALPLSKPTVHILHSTHTHAVSHSTHVHTDL